MEIKTYQLNKLKPTSVSRYDLELLENISYSNDYFKDHKEIFHKLKQNKLYLATIIIENLKPVYYLRKKYAEKIVEPMPSKYQEMLYKYFFDEYGQMEGNEVYGKFLDKYQTAWRKDARSKNIDNYIIKKELEPRYREKILKRFKNIKKLMAPRVSIERERYYNLPAPLNYVDWRTPYDNIFVWERGGKKYCVRGGSGSSGGRENNSKFIYGFSLINKTRPIPSYLFIYSDENELKFIKKFDRLTVPDYDIGSNYHLPASESDKILSGVNFLQLSNFGKVESITIMKF